MNFYKKKKFWIFLVLFLTCLIVSLCPYFFLTIQINGNSNMQISYKEQYYEEGATATLFNHLLTVNVINTIDTSKLGKQEVIYQVKNKIGIIKKKKRVVTIIDNIPPTLTLLGNTTITIRKGEEYIDPGYILIDNVDGDISNQVKIKGKIDNNKLGIYKLSYEGEDSNHNKVTSMRKIEVIEKEVTYQEKYDDIDNTPKTWWSGNKKNKKRPLQGAASTIEDLKKHNAYYLGPDEKIIYLTFDEGADNTYVKEITEVLNKHNIKATFFFCNGYMQRNPEVIKKIAISGHSVGNHTAHHEKMYQFATKDKIETYISEIRTTENTFYEITGQKMDKVYREPSGDWSYRSLEIMKDMGYKTFFWSADYLDWNGDVSKNIALTNLLSKYHNGAIYLIHPKNKGNYEALDSFIKKMKDLGYEFGLVKDIQ